MGELASETGKADNGQTMATRQTTLENRVWTRESVSATQEKIKEHYGVLLVLEAGIHGSQSGRLKY